MYDLYKKESDETKQQIVSKKSIFKEMNISFYNPRKDQCDMCVGYRENSIEKSAYDKHVDDKEWAWHFKSIDKELANANWSVKFSTWIGNNCCYVRSRFPRVFSS